MATALEADCVLASTWRGDACGASRRNICGRLSLRRYREGDSPDVNAYSSAMLVGPLEYKVGVKIRSKEQLRVVKRELVGLLEFLSQFD